MSTLENTAVTDAGKIPLGRRIGELINEQGDANSIRKFADQIGLNRETLRKMVTEGRHIAPSELRQIAEGLQMPVERIKQIDTEKTERELKSLFHAKKRTKVMLMRTLELARYLVSVAKGVTERCQSINYLGQAQYLLEQYDEAHENWLRALDLAKEILMEYGETSLLHHVTKNLMATYTLRREYSNIEELLQVVESVFSTNPSAMGLACYTRMKMHEVRGNHERAKKYAYAALEYYKQTYDNEQIGRAIVNVAHFEFASKNYEEADKLLRDSLPLLEPFDYSFIFAVNELVKVMIKRGKHSAAKAMIEEHFELAKQYHDFYGRLQISNTVATRNPHFAEKTLNDTTVSASVRQLACKCLISYYSSIDDAESVLRYYKMERIYSNRDSEYFNWEA
ncbi:hypothetical protein CBW65_04335 [Tumebacillus avium]|uniref:HTH cro/C1-type domain-containing protein n=1 Tax=Tumebacillus avium TaxID=1903704 RepID=A0A1Y0IIT8_9BACL|nr:helix-turn-helix transcriptional regulator [Tumebacillus avium]ARU60378.1 hypothetical protein CBW65_04335 [Tumebacillus avium]